MVYTRTGDKGKTSVIGGRVDKDDIRVEAYGTTDELKSFVGQTMSVMLESPDKDKFQDMHGHLQEIQHELFDCGSDLALLKREGREYKVTAEMVERLEQWIDAYHGQAPEIIRFILPGGHHVSSLLHVCRTVCRRAERRVVTLAKNEEINMEVLRYLNRLSDLFFVMARAVNARTGVGDVEYKRSGEVFGKRKS